MSQPRHENIFSGDISSLSVKLVFVFSGPAYGKSFLRITAYFPQYGFCAGSCCIKIGFPVEHY
jgi:hypothetical protein